MEGKFFEWAIRLKGITEDVWTPGERWNDYRDDLRLFGNIRYEADEMTIGFVSCFDMVVNYPEDAIKFLDEQIEECEGDPLFRNKCGLLAYELMRYLDSRELED